MSAEILSDKVAKCYLNIDKKLMKGREGKPEGKPVLKTQLRVKFFDYSLVIFFQKKRNVTITKKKKKHQNAICTTG